MAPLEGAPYEIGQSITGTPEGAPYEIGCSTASAIRTLAAAAFVDLEQ